MSTNHALEVQLRTVAGKKVKDLRQAGLLPAVVYGKDVEAIAVQVDERTFGNVYRKVGHSALIDLQIPGQPKQAAFVHDVQRHPVSRAIMHADLRVVDLKVAITTSVPIVLTGETELIARGDAVVNQSLMEIELHALPGDLPHNIEIDISGLDSLEKNIHVSDIAATGNYTIVTDPEAVIVSLTQVRAAVEAEEEEETAVEPELVRKEQEEQDEEE
jgi:large subunit ribosomal protein L25